MMVGRVGLFLHAITVLLGVVGAISANDFTIHEAAKAACRRPSAEWRAA